MAQQQPPQQQQQQQLQQPQYQMPGQIPGRPFSPSQPTPSPGTPQGFYQPATKRQRLSPDPRSQPTSPYTQSPYGPSPTTSAPPSSISSASSMHFPTVSLPQVYQGPYSNGNTTASLSHPSPYSTPTTQPQSYNPNNPPTPSLHGVSPQNLHPNVPPNTQFQNTYNMPPQHGVGMMGPPLKPVEKDLNDDQMDVLANAGVDLRAEENFAMSFHTGSFGTQPAFNQPGVNLTGQAFTQFGPGDAASFYGAGPANQPGVAADKATQDQLLKSTAEAAWNNAAFKLAMSRQHELRHPHVQVSALWVKMEKIAKENGLVLNTEQSGKMPQLKLPSEHPSEIKLRTVKGPDGALVVAKGTFLPQDTALADQCALMSLATNQRIRILLEETVAIARSRRLGSHGVIPSEWTDVAAPSTSAAGTVVPEGAPRNGWESAVSPRTTLPSDALTTAGMLPTPTSDGIKTPTGTVTMTNELIKALREAANTERNFEEKRLAKRQGRSAEGAAVARVGTVAPGTPGTVAPEPSAKPLTKKEREKQDRGKQSLVDSHAQANATTATFLFGGKKKNKYSWMESGASSSVSTLGRISTQAPGVSGGLGAVEKQRLTADGKNRMGGFREDKGGGRMVQLRDFLAVLENDGREKKTLQRTYAWLDAPKPKPSVA